jgi:hypothetical protein
MLPAVEQARHAAGLFVFASVPSQLVRRNPRIVGIAGYPMTATLVPRQAAPYIHRSMAMMPTRPPTRPLAVGLHEQLGDLALVLGGGR